MDQHFDRLEALLKAIETNLRAQEICTKDKDMLLEIEKVRGELRAYGERQKVHEGMMSGQLTRLHDRLDKLQNENAGLRENAARKDSEQNDAINKINMHLRYTAGGFAALVLLLNFFEKIRTAFGLLLGGKP